MEKLILEKNMEDYYVMEVNDKGDTIEIDLTDMGLIERMMNAGDNIEKYGKEYSEREKTILENTELSDEERVRQLIELDDEHDKKMRKLFDSFLTEGACDKIFGDKKSAGQYNKLMDALDPHFKKMKIQREKAQQRLANKYLDKKSDVI